MRKRHKVFAAKTSIGASSVVFRYQLMGNVLRQPVMAKLEMTYAASPTITIAIQGSNDGGKSWVDLVTGIYTTGTPKYLRVPAHKTCRRYRLNISAINNVTVAAAYIGIGSVQD